MADWNTPDINTNYTTVLTNLKDRDVDAATMFAGSPSNIPTNAVKWLAANNKFQRYSGAVWNDMVIALEGGGTGATTQAGARSALGLGSMATQANTNVNITGGTITGITFSATNITSGEIALARGGTGASLALGGNGTVLGSNGSAVVFMAGTSIAALSATNLTTGTIPDARFPATLPAASGINLTALNASNIASGNLGIARLPTSGTWTLAGTLTIGGDGIVIGGATGGNKGVGTINAEKLYINGTEVSTGGGGGSVPAGTVMIYDGTSCPTGWTRWAALDDRMPVGKATGIGTLGGQVSHYHGVDINAGYDGGHSHTGTTNTADVQPTGSDVFAATDLQFALTDLLNAVHAHGFTTDSIGNHSHLVAGDTDWSNGTNDWPSWRTVLWCRKD